MSRHFTEDLYSPSEEDDDLDDMTLTNGSSTSYLPLDSEDDLLHPTDYQLRHRVGSHQGHHKHHHKSGRHRDHVHHHGHSFGTSISTIPRLGDSGKNEDIQEVYSELQNINMKLKEEFHILHERDLILKEKERAFSTAKANFDEIVKKEVNRLIAEKEQELNAEIDKLDQQIKEKCRENKRLKENFDTLKAANDTMRNELEKTQQQHEKLEKQSASLQARLANLQRKQEHSDRKDEFFPTELAKAKKSAVKENKNGKPSLRPSAGLFELLSILLEWISEVHLRHATTDQPSKPLADYTSLNFLQDKCFKVLPGLVEILRDLPGGSTKLTLPCLQFVHWSLVYTEQPQGQQKVTFPSTLRRLGEELYKPRVVRFNEEESNSKELVNSSCTDRTKETLYFRSNDLQIRFLSSLVILRTHLQVDHLAHVLEIVRTDMKSDKGKELFLHYQATPVFFSLFRPANKTLTNSCVDIYLQMSMESAVLPLFLASCSNEMWFRQVSMLFRMPNPDQKLVEKLSIIFQKLSKIKSNRKYFEVFGVTTACQEMLRTAGSDNAFLTLNLKSILFNLNPKAGPVARNT